MRLLKALSICLFSAFFAANAENLVKNGFFSEDIPKYGELPPGWTFSSPDSKAWGFINDDGVSGNDALRFSVKPNPGNASQIIKVAGNADYTLLFYYKNSGAAPSVQIEADGVGIIASFSTDTSIRDTWIPAKVNFNTGKATEVTLKLIGDYKGAPAGTSSFDNIEILPRKEADARPPLKMTESKGDNLALHKKYTFAAKPNYSFSTDPDDITQLTDGGRTVGYFWTQKSTVGWHQVKPIIVTIDLEKTEPICGASWTAAAGERAGVFWPLSILVFTSDDNKSWNYVGDLVQLGTEKEALANGAYRVFTFSTRSFQTKGRYVAFLATARPASGLFCDEIEVFKGDEQCLTNPKALKKVNMSIAEFVKYNAIHLAITRRLSTDLNTLKKAIEALPASYAQRTQALANVEACEKELASPPYAEPFEKSSILPYPSLPLSGKIFALNAHLMQAKGWTKPFIWRNNRWDNQTLLNNAPNGADNTPLKVATMRGEVRADAFVIANPTDKDISFNVSASGFDKALNVDLRQVIYTETNQNMMIGSALKPIGKDQVTVPAGCNVQIWMSIYRPTAKAGTYNGTISAVSENASLSINASVKVYDFDFPRQPTLHVGGWQYAGVYNSKNMQANIDIMRDFYTDSPWGTSALFPDNAKFNAEGRLINKDELNFSRFDAWIAQWPGSRNYCIANFTSRANFFREPMGTPRFEIMLVDYYKAVDEHMTALGLKPQQLVYLFLDEPHLHKQDELIIKWLSPLRRGNVQMRLFEDPTYSDPTKGLPEAFSVCDILCPNTPMMITNGKPFKDFYTKQRLDGRELWFYSCLGPAKHLDPINYWRGQKWHCFDMKAVGSFYWAFGSTGGLGSSWRAYEQSGVEYSPYFVSEEGAMESKQSEGIREGVQDYEYLVMLRSAIARMKKVNPGHPALAGAEKLLEEAPKAVLAAITSTSLQWSNNENHSLMDDYDIKLLDALNALK